MAKLTVVRMTDTEVIIRIEGSALRAGSHGIKTPIATCIASKLQLPPPSKLSAKKGKINKEVLYFRYVR